MDRFVTSQGGGGFSGGNNWVYGCVLRYRSNDRLRKSVSPINGLSGYLLFHYSLFCGRVLYDQTTVRAKFFI